jgi:adenosylmethionine-8-amino-7-oxononanoate aminotransferase
MQARQQRVSVVDSFVADELDRLTALGLRRQLLPHGGPQGVNLEVEGERFINFSSNDYLGLANDARVVAAAHRALDQYGVGAGASRLVVGDTTAHHALETSLAHFKGTARALLFNSGYAANTAVVSALVGPGDVVFSDALNHASLIDGCRLSRAKVVVYPHCDPDRLAALLGTHRGRRRLVVTDSVFSMDGDVAPLRSLLSVCQAFEAGLYVDEAHATGVFGKSGAGVCEQEDVHADVRMGTLSKALGASGAYVAGSNVLIDFLLSSARPLMFSTALPAAVVAAASESLECLRTEPALRERLWRNIGHFATGAQALGFDVKPQSPVFSLVLGAPETALEASAALKRAGYLVKAIRPPTVPAGTSRLRVAMSAAHTPEQIDGLIAALDGLRPQRFVHGGMTKGSEAPPARSNPNEPQHESGRTQQLRRLDAMHVWHPFTQMRQWPDDDPLIIERAEGSWLIDTEGRRYLDAISSLWVTVHGHRHPRIDAAIKRQLDLVAHSTLLGLASVPSIELAARLAALAPSGLSHVFYSDAGSTAVEIAVKMAYQYWQLTGRPKKHRFVALSEAYHGDTIGSVSVGGMELFHERFRRLLFPVERIPSPHAYRWEGSDVLGESLAAAERVLSRQHDELAALVIEPLVQGAAGMWVQPRGYLRALADLCRKYDVLLICDEVATGFGRTGTMFAVEQEGVTPDLLCLAKGLSGGYLPLAATLASERIYDAFLGDFAEAKTFFHGHTYTGNPLACAAALASLEVFEAEATLSRMQPVAKALRDGLLPLAAHPHVGDIRQRGLMVGIELVKSQQTKAPFDFSERIGFRVCREARKHGVWLRPLGNVVVVMPPLSLSLEEAGLVTGAIRQSIESVFNA